MTNKLNLTPELLKKAKAAPSSAVLLALAQENGIALTNEEATLYFAQLHHESGVLSDEELDNVAGGGGLCGTDPCPGCTSSNTKTAGTYFKCNNCGRTGTKMGGKITLRD
ncbi:MAG: hypothetical protein RRX92_00955 [Lachnospiraceae bacterium]